MGAHVSLLFIYNKYFFGEEVGIDSLLISYLFTTDILGFKS